MLHDVIAALAFSIALLSTPVANDDFARFIYPTAPPIPSPQIVIDVTDSPESQAWAERAADLAREWFPTLTSLLATQEFRVPERINLVFKKELNVPAHASRDTITINGDWIRRRPDDFGMVIHELVHVIQAYPRNRHNTGWLVEGIADYIRWWRYEPEARRTPIDAARASYRDAYRTTAAFLAWAGEKYDRRLVPALDEALRRAEDPAPVFEKFTQKDLDALWQEFVSQREYGVRGG
jgi:hypothetical protein